jgi:hypothetical protein
LRAHAEWIIGRTLFVSQGVLRLEQEAPGRLRQEPSVFGGSSGAEVLVEVVRRVIPPDEAGRRLGGLAARIVEGPSALLSECALSAEERVVVAGARGLDVEEICRGVGGNDFVCVIYALSLLGVLAVEVPSRAAVHEPAGPDVDALDVAAVRDRVRARIELVSEADYFSLLGVARDATGYEIRREYLRLRRDFEPALLLTPETLDLVDDLTTIRDVLDEAYDILKDTARRERYRRALGDPL